QAILIVRVEVPLVRTERPHVSAELCSSCLKAGRRVRLELDRVSVVEAVRTVGTRSQAWLPPRIGLAEFTQLIIELGVDCPPICRRFGLAAVSNRSRLILCDGTPLRGLIAGHQCYAYGVEDLAGC